MIPAEGLAKGAPRSRFASRLAAAAALLVGCSGSGDVVPARNLLLVTFDTTRADHLGCYGNEAAVTPTLDRLAEEGVLFEHCIAVTPITLPSHASILTGLYPFRHGVRNNGTHRLPETVPTLAGSLAARGFATGAVVSAIVLDSRYGLDRGFDEYDDDLAGADRNKAFRIRETRAEDTTQRALEWLERRGDERWFLWVHYFDPHADYQPPEPVRADDAVARYDGEITYADGQLGVLLEHLTRRGRLDETLIVATADHGESLGEHGEDTHGVFLYDATTRVPLIVRFPGLPAGRRIEGVVSLVDVVPSALELLDVPAAGDLDGRSLARAATGEVELEPVHVYSESLYPLYNYGWSELRAVRDGGGRYVRAPRPELYDLERDAGELANLLPGADERARPYATALSAMLPDVEADSRAGTIERMDPELRGALAQLGYVWSAAEDGAADPEAREDPKDGIASLARLEYGKQLALEGRPEEAEPVLREVLAADPESAHVHEILTQVLLDLGRREAALEVLRAAVKLDGVQSQYLVLTAGLERDLGVGDWRASLELAKSFDPRDAQPWMREGQWARDDGDPRHALVATERALEIDPACVGAWISLGRLAYDAADRERAEEHFRKAVALDPYSYRAWFVLGVVLEDLGRAAEALACYEKTAELSPSHAAARAKVELLAARGPETWRKAMLDARRRGDSGGVVAAADRLLRAVPDDIAALMQSAVACAALGREAEALDRVRRAVVIDAARVRKRATKDTILADLLEKVGG